MYKQGVEVRGIGLEKRGTARLATHHNITAPTHEYRHSDGRHGEVRAQLYHRPADICIMPGEMLDGGLAMRMPVEGFTMGMALVPERMADGW